jgi:hypothetical protein
MIKPLFKAKIRGLKKLLKQDDLRPVLGGQPNKVFGPLDVIIDIVTACHLGRSNRQLSHLSLL